MPPRMIPGLHIPRRAAHPDIDLIIDRARPGLQLPMQLARCQVEGARVQQQEAALARRDGGHFREADVVADCEGDAAVRGQVDQGKFVAGAEDVGFSEGYFAGDGDVEEVEFAVGG